jgi:hypothetical protein
MVAGALRTGTSATTRTVVAFENLAMQVLALMLLASWVGVAEILLQGRCECKVSIARATISLLKESMVQMEPVLSLSQAQA